MDDGVTCWCWLCELGVVTWQRYVHGVTLYRRGQIMFSMTVILVGRCCVVIVQTMLRGAGNEYQYRHGW